MTKQTLPVTRVSSLLVAPFPKAGEGMGLEFSGKGLSVSGYFMVDPSEALNASSGKDSMGGDRHPVIHERMVKRRRKALSRLFFGM